MNSLRQALGVDHDGLDVQCIGLSGQMHGEVLVDGDFNVLVPARLPLINANPKG